MRATARSRGATIPPPRPSVGGRRTAPRRCCSSTALVASAAGAGARVSSVLTGARRRLPSSLGRFSRAGASRTALSRRTLPAGSERGASRAGRADCSDSRTITRSDASRARSARGTAVSRGGGGGGCCAGGGGGGGSCAITAWVVPKLSATSRAVVTTTDHIRKLLRTRNARAREGSSKKAGSVLCLFHVRTVQRLCQLRCAEYSREFAGPGRRRYRPLTRAARSVFLDTPSKQQIASEMIHATTILAVRHRDKAVMAGDGQVTLGHRRSSNTAARSGGCTTTASSPDSPGPPPMLSRCSRGSKPSSNSTAATSSARPSNSQRTGDRSALRRLEAMLVVVDQKKHSSCRAPAM